MVQLNSNLFFTTPDETPPGVVITAPISGEVLPIEDHTEALFSNRTLGEGVVLKITGNQIIAPFDGSVLELPTTGHRIQLVSDNGIRLLITMGSHCNELMGQGFKLNVRQGQAIKQGQLLLQFDIRLLQSVNPALECPVIITNSEKLGQIYVSRRRITQGEDPLFTLIKKKEKL